MACTGCCWLPNDRTEVLIDARGLKCPLPVLKLEKALANAKAGSVLTVLATDPVARIDIPLLCRQRGHAVSVEEDGEALRFTVTVAG
jgi:tRNA 2-thiouridine synthesizing protein A